MAVDPGQIKIDPYTSTVPLVQIPPEQMDAGTRPEAPLPGQFGKKGTGALAIGDALMKGFLQGHAIKEQKKSQEAMAQYQSGSAQIQAAKATYQQAIDSGQAKANDPNDPAYLAYQKAVTPILAQLQPLTEPQKAAKGQKKSAKEEIKGFGSGIKDFMAANQHIIPSLAMMAMAPQPLGKTPEGETKNLELNAAKRQDQTADLQLQEAQRTRGAQKVYDQFSGLSAEELAKLPKEVQQQYESAKNVLFPPRTTGTTYLYRRGNSIVRIRPDEVVPGDEPYIAGQQAKPGSPGFYLEQYAKENGIGVEDLSTEDLDYIQRKQAYDRVQPRTTSNTSTTDIHGDHHSVTAQGVGAAPQPPAGRKFTWAPQQDSGGQPAAAGGGITSPPTAPRASVATGGSLTSPPQRVGKTTLTDANRLKDWNERSQKAETAKAKGFSDAEAKYQKALRDADADLSAAKIDDAGKAKRVKDAETLRNAEQKAAADAYDQASAALAREQNTLPTKGQITVKVPGAPGGGFIFPNQEAADNYKREAGLK